MKGILTFLLYCLVVLCIEFSLDYVFSFKFFELILAPKYKLLLINKHPLFSIFKFATKVSMCVHWQHKKEVQYV